MNCEICKSNFSWFRKKQTQCKRCQRLICTTCSSFQQTVQNSALIYMNICRICQEDITYIRKTIQENMCSWNHNSLIAKTWVKDMEIARQEYQIIEDEDTAKAVMSEFQSLQFNYSLQEFFYYLWRSFHPDQIQKTLIQVVVTFASRNPQVGFNGYLIQIVLFLLCFAKDFVVLKIMEDLYNKIPQQFHPKYQQSVDFISDVEWMNADALQDLKCRFKFEQHQIMNAKQFIESNMLHYKNALLLQLQFPCCYCIINQIINNEPTQEIDKYFSSIIKININNLNKSDTEQLITRYTLLKDLQHYASNDIQRTSLYYHSAVELRYNTPSPVKQRKTQRTLTTLQFNNTNNNITEFDSEIEDKSQSQVKMQQQEVMRLTNELMYLEQQISELKNKNQQMENILESNNNNQALKILNMQFEDLFQEILEQSDQFLKMQMSL